MMGLKATATMVGPALTLSLVNERREVTPSSDCDGIVDGLWDDDKLFGEVAVGSTGSLTAQGSTAPPTVVPSAAPTSSPPNLSVEMVRRGRGPVRRA